MTHPLRSSSDSLSPVFHSTTPLALDCGAELPHFHIAYQTWGQLNKHRSNAILVCHALTGDQFATGKHPLSQKDGWWHHVVGPDKPIDTNKYFVICSNVLGGCMGTTGPQAPRHDKKDTRPWGSDFPVLTIRDMVRAQKRLIDHLTIDQLFCVIGGSMGGMQVLQWATTYPEHVFAAVAIATSTRHTTQNISFHEIGRQAIMADANWHNGHYYDQSRKPDRGLAVARMVAHITYLSEQALHQKFGRNLQNRHNLSYGFDADFQVESYLRYQGAQFVDRFDANTYLYITRAMDYFDLAGEHGGTLAKAFQKTRTRFYVVSFSSDWLFPTSESRLIVKALNAAAVPVSFTEVTSDKGHDAFLLNEPRFHELLHGFLEGAAHHHPSP
ncbi:MAG: homoserine O-acetyltransferase [Alphaproteobacteria bacterium GM202ARS2]|nr:homoserine O-acetyltransferase [Alphaproteobacteria bacterium GM202ARS2]